MSHGFPPPFDPRHASQAAQPPKRRRVWPWLVGVLVVGALAFGGCAAVVAGIADTATNGVTTDDTDTGSDPDADSSTDASTDASDPPSDATTPRFGQTVTFDDGSTLTCRKPVPFKRARFAAGGDDAKVLLKVKCTFHNGGSETFDPSLTDGSMSAGGAEGESVYQDGLDAPDNPVLPGKSVTWWMGFGVQSRADVQVTVGIGFLDYDDVTFTEATP